MKTLFLNVPPQEEVAGVKLGLLSSHKLLGINHQKNDFKNSVVALKLCGLAVSLKCAIIFVWL